MGSIKSTEERQDHFISAILERTNTHDLSEFTTQIVSSNTMQSPLKARLRQ